MVYCRHGISNYAGSFTDATCPLIGHALPCSLGSGHLLANLVEGPILGGRINSWFPVTFDAHPDNIYPDNIYIYIYIYIYIPWPASIRMYCLEAAMQLKPTP
jgi:hypothetical protein